MSSSYSCVLLALSNKHWQNYENLVFLLILEIVLGPICFLERERKKEEIELCSDLWFSLAEKEKEKRKKEI